VTEYGEISGREVGGEVMLGGLGRYFLEEVPCT